MVGLESLRCPPIPLPVSLDFGRPEWPVRPGNVAAVGTAVPEAAINENRHTSVREQKIGIAPKSSRTNSPAPYATARKSKAQPCFRGLVAVASYSSHCPGAGRRNTPELPARQVLPQRAFQSSNPLIIEGRHRCREPN